jgi:hypothetical protein
MLLGDAAASVNGDAAVGGKASWVCMREGDCGLDDGSERGMR